MLTLGIHHPPDPPPRAAPDDALRRARQEVAGISDAFARVPFAFHALGEGECAALVPEDADGGTWLLVTVDGEADRWAHVHERCLTAAQRFMLSLACDGVDSEWVTDGLPNSRALRAVGVDVGAARPVGWIRCHTARS